jgi:hypothetical protein
MKLNIYDRQSIIRGKRYNTLSSENNFLIYIQFLQIDTFYFPL